jgi:hypothetical protein
MRRSISAQSLSSIGTILNVINQGDAILRSGTVSWWKVVLTYCVPFCVATFGAYAAFRQAGPSP